MPFRWASGLCYCLLLRPAHAIGAVLPKSRVRVSSDSSLSSLPGLKRIERVPRHLSSARHGRRVHIAVTGTSGKSTTATIIFHLLRESGFRVGLISTVGAIAGDETIDTGFHVTTPDPIDLQKILRKMKNKKMDYVVVEASSHSLDQGR